MGKIVGWASDLFKVASDAGTERTIFDDDGYIYQCGTKITADPAYLNGTAAVYDNRIVRALDGSTGKKACSVNGLNVITGGTGIADMTLAAPTPGARCVIRIASLSSGSVVVTAGSGVTLNGTNTVATFDAVNEALVLVYKADNTWEVELNVGAVALSGP